MSRPAQREARHASKRARSPCNFPAGRPLQTRRANILGAGVSRFSVQGSGTGRRSRSMKGSFMGAKIKVAGWLALGAVAGALATMQLTAIARSSVAQLPLEELQQLA